MSWPKSAGKSASLWPPRSSPRLDLGISKASVDLLVELVDYLGRRGVRCADAIPGARLISRHELSEGRNVRQRFRAHRATAKVGMSGSASARIALVRCWLKNICLEAPTPECRRLVGALAGGLRPKIEMHAPGSAGRGYRRRRCEHVRGAPRVALTDRSAGLLASPTALRRLQCPLGGGRILAPDLILAKLPQAIPVGDV